ncbi:MAG: hypothetical protein ACRCV3_04900 [Desulfovibrionaceae bacterium]
MNPILHYLGNTSHKTLSKSYLRALSHNPPQLVLLEGGTREERIYNSLYIMTAIQCESENTPCLTCSSCLSILSKHIASEEYRELEKSNKKDHGIYFRFGDMHYFDARYGLYSNQIRTLKKEISSSPKKKHIICIIELQEAHSIKELSNALLKIVEEPDKTLFFIITTPIHSQIVPTIVSRAHVITLAWPASHSLHFPSLHIIQEMETFLQTGKGYFTQQSTHTKTLDTEQLHTIFTYFQVALCQALKKNPINTLSKILSTYSTKKLYFCGEVITQYQEQLKANVSPSLIVDTFILTLYTNLYR